MFRYGFAVLCTCSLFAAKLSPQTASATNQFGMELFYYINQPGKNVVISPVTINSALVMAYIGADGSTEKNMAKVLGIKATKRALIKDFGSYLRSLEKSSFSASGYHLSLKNFMFLQKEFSPTTQFRKSIEDGFDGQVAQVDFRKPSLATRTINKNISQATGGVIKDLIAQQDITGATRMVLANGSLFQGNWTYPFPTEKTRNAVFYPYGKDKPTMVKTMFGEFYIPYYEDSSLQAIALPVKGRKEQAKLVAIFVLPKNDHSDTPAFNHLYTGLTPQSLLRKMKDSRVKVGLPKVHAAIRLPLTSTLKSIGMDLPFSSGADFRDITGKPNLSMSFFTSSASFTLNESGIAAASGSGAGFQIKSSRTNKKPLSFTANRPFAYMLYDETSDVILYIGEYDSPTPETFADPKVTLVPQQGQENSDSTKLPMEDESDLNVDDPTQVDSDPADGVN